MHHGSGKCGVDALGKVCAYLAVGNWEATVPHDMFRVRKVVEDLGWSEKFEPTLAFSRRFPSNFECQG